MNYFEIVVHFIFFIIINKTRKHVRKKNTIRYDRTEKKIESLYSSLSLSLFILIQFKMDVDTMFRSTVENLFNDLFYEIFDYLEGRDLVKAFSNINYRFQRLLKSLSLLLKIDDDRFLNRARSILTNCSSSSYITYKIFIVTTSLFIEY